jgi:hypothetical protein
MSQVPVIALTQAIAREGNPDPNAKIYEIIIADYTTVPGLQGFKSDNTIKES